MKPIILASASAQRKKLLQLTGLKFRVKVSRARELNKVQTTCSALVKHNALLKARDIAAQTDDGIIIAADSVVYLKGKKIIGKPRNLKQAKRILKMLFSQPHWVYTGLVVMDARSGKTKVDYEKTKVYMVHLTDQEIDRYHGKMSPLDKAGGFDIEGHGSLFIRRIEGCYTNVIGLPMARLRIMLKDFGISVL
jgi:septum formation protein